MVDINNEDPSNLARMMITWSMKATLIYKRGMVLSISEVVLLTSVVRDRAEVYAKKMAFITIRKKVLVWVRSIWVILDLVCGLIS